MEKKIFDNVSLGDETTVSDFCEVGVPPRGKTDGELKTIIGEKATIRSKTTIYAGNKIGDNFNTGHNVMIRELNEIGDNVSVGTNSNIEHHVKVGSGVRIHSNVFIPEFSVIEDKAWIGPNVVMTNAYHPLCKKAKECLVGPTVKEGAKVGANSTLLPGVTIGKGALVGAGSVVTKDVEDGMVVAGNPAKPIKKVSELTCKTGLCEKPY